MPFRPIVLTRPIRVDRVVTVHYFEHSSSYYFEGERHDFWELLYVDRGEVDVLTESAVRRLGRGEIVFHCPGEFHALRATGASAPNLVVVSFFCRDPAMDFFTRRFAATGDAERALLGRIVTEGEHAFSTPLDDPATTALDRREDAPFGCEQLLGAALEELLIRLIRRGEGRPSAPAATVGDAGKAALFRSIEDYLARHLDRPLTLREICADNFVGRSRLQQLFRTYTGGGVMEHVGRLRVLRARDMIREGAGNFTEISAALGYQSLHYFSRHFKKVTGMSPSEYAASVRVLSGKTRPG